MEELIDELLKKVTKIEKIPEIYEILLKLKDTNVQSKEEIQKFIDIPLNLEEK